TVSARLERLQERRDNAEGRVKLDFDPSDYSIESQFAVFVDPPASALRERDLRRDSVVEYGVRWNSENETFVLPIHNPRGTLIGWQERTKPKPDNYPRGLKKKTTLFGIEIFRGNTAILVESPLDAVRLWSEGIDGGLSSFGARVSHAQMQLIIARAKRLIIALDDDEAGINMTNELVERYAHRLPVHRFNYGDAEGKDPGEMSGSEILRGIREAEFTLQVRRSRRVRRTPAR
ncbi:MAG: toprim domain-containing protein, partial [Actinomycetota bacterium]